MLYNDTDRQAAGAFWARVVLVTDRGILTQVQIEKIREIEGFDWITALRSPSIARPDWRTMNDYQKSRKDD